MNAIRHILLLAIACMPLAGLSQEGGHAGAAANSLSVDTAIARSFELDSVTVTAKHITHTTKGYKALIASEKMFESHTLLEAMTMLPGLFEREGKLKAYGKEVEAVYVNGKRLQLSTSQSCDYSLLSRVHGQTARLFLEQEAPNNALDEIEKVNKYAQLSKDTLMLLVNEGVRANAYTMLGNEDSLISIYMRVHQEWKDYGNDAYAAMVQAPAIVYLLNKGKIKRAQELLTEYEKNSGMVTNGNVVDGQEIYYYVKGRYYAEVGDIDSAFIFFRKALKKCRKADEQAIISYHLANLFQKTGNKDSAFLYWRKSYNELDSAHIKMGTERLQRLKANYDYGFQKRIAEQKKKDSIRNRNVAALLGLLFLLSLIAIHAIILHVKRYKEKTRERENQLQQKLAELEDLAMSKNMAERESSLMESEIRARFAGLLNKKEHPKPSYSDWKELRSFVAEKAPQFYELVNASNLTSDEVDICILIRLHFLPAQIHCFTGLTVAHISVIRKRLLHKVFHTSNGGAREFDEKLRNL